MWKAFSFSQKTRQCPKGKSRLLKMIFLISHIFLIYLSLDLVSELLLNFDCGFKSSAFCFEWLLNVDCSAHFLLETKAPDKSCSSSTTSHPESINNFFQKTSFRPDSESSWSWFIFKSNPPILSSRPYQPNINNSDFVILSGGSFWHWWSVKGKRLKRRLAAATAGAWIN